VRARRRRQYVAEDPGPLNCNQSVGTCRAASGLEFRCVELPLAFALADPLVPHPACLNLKASVAACPRGGWLCYDTGLAATAGPLLARRPADEVLSRDSPDVPVIAVIAAATARGQRAPALATCPLLSMLLPSLLETAEPGFEYWLVVAYDVGDPLFDDPTARARARAYFAAHAARLRRSAGGVTVKLALLRFLNGPRKPGPAFNYVAAAAFRDGADFFYRVNDDSILVTPWARAFVGALRALRPPLVGVVGPTCLEGKKSILTHDFTHRTHQVTLPAARPAARGPPVLAPVITGSG
jgi:hypothetical protein